MRSIPNWLPPAQSKKWHNRRLWDPLGYIRVRTLANPSWQRDIDWLILLFDRHRPQQPGAERDTLDNARNAARTYRALQRQGRDEEPHWDAMIDALDSYLQMVQEQHLQDVEEAGASGRG